MAERKEAARRAAMARRAAAHEAAGPDEAARLMEVIAGYRGRPLAGYAAMRTEIDPRPAMVAAAIHGPVAMPVVEGPARPLAFRAWTPDAAMVPGTFGTAIPASGAPVTPEVVIVPLLAFDRSGGRLGYGGGFYDRTLAMLRRTGPVVAIGFAYAAQETTDLPLESTDAPLDLIVTEAEIIDLR